MGIVWHRVGLVYARLSSHFGAPEVCSGMVQHLRESGQRGQTDDRFFFPGTNPRGSRVRGSGWPSPITGPRRPRPTRMLAPGDQEDRSLRLRRCPLRLGLRCGTGELGVGGEQMVRLSVPSTGTAGAGGCSRCPGPEQNAARQRSEDPPAREERGRSAQKRRRHCRNSPRSIHSRRLQEGLRRKAMLAQPKHRERTAVMFGSKNMRVQ